MAGALAHSVGPWAHLTQSARLQGCLAVVLVALLLLLGSELLGGSAVFRRVGQRSAVASAQMQRRPGGLKQLASTLWQPSAAELGAPQQGSEQEGSGVIDDDDYALQSNPSSTHKQNASPEQIKPSISTAGHDRIAGGQVRVVGIATANTMLHDAGR